jgi:hypothetical protein
MSKSELRARRDKIMKKLHDLWGKARRMEYDQDIKREWGCFERQLREYFDHEHESRKHS